MLLSCVRLFATPWTVAYQVPPTMGFSRNEYWSGLPFPSPGDLPNPGIKPRSPALHVDSLLIELPGKSEAGRGDFKKIKKKKKKMRAWTSFRVKKKKIVSVQINFGDNCKKLENF